MTGPPPRRSPGGESRAPSKIIVLGGSDKAKIPARRASRSATLTYLAGREKVLGRRFWLSDDPRVAARQLFDRRGPLAGRAWARQLLAEMEGL